MIKIRKIVKKNRILNYYLNNNVTKKNHDNDVEKMNNEKKEYLKKPQKWLISYSSSYR